MRRWSLVALTLLLVPVLAAAQSSNRAHASPFEPLRFLAGTWKGTSAGQPGQGTCRRTFSFALGDRYLEIRNASTYPPQAKNPKGEHHEDRGFVSFDRARHRFVYRQFHIEGFVNQYVADSLAAGADSVVFNSELIENIPPGWRARETWRFVSKNELEERFELAEPGKEFELYSRTRLRRV